MRRFILLRGLFVFVLFGAFFPRHASSRTGIRTGRCDSGAHHPIWSARLDNSAAFKVYVRECAWLIEIGGDELVGRTKQRRRLVQWMARRYSRLLHGLKAPPALLVTNSRAIKYHVISWGMTVKAWWLSNSRSGGYDIQPDV